VLAEVESVRAVARHAPASIGRLQLVLDLIDLIDLDASIRITAQGVAPASVRSVDAIHLATALRLRQDLTSFVTYDKRLADAATLSGLTVDMPGACGRARTPPGAGGL
jgi:predicted nucleic acid-binding protein